MNGVFPGNFQKKPKNTVAIYFLVIAKILQLSYSSHPDLQFYHLLQKIYKLTIYCTSEINNLSGFWNIFKYITLPKYFSDARRQNLTHIGHFNSWLTLYLSSLGLRSCRCPSLYLLCVRTKSIAGTKMSKNFYQKLCYLNWETAQTWDISWT